MGTCPSSQGNCDMTFDITVLREGASFQMAVEIRRLAASCCGSAELFPVGFQYPHDRNYRVPVPRRGRYPEYLIDPAQIADGFHVTTVQSEDESAFRSDNSQEPLIS